MKTLDLRHEHPTVEELLRLAQGDPVLILNRDGGEFILEAADAFDREAAALGRSETFLAFLAERARESGETPLEEIDRRLAGSGPSGPD